MKKKAWPSMPEHRALLLLAALCLATLSPWGPVSAFGPGVACADVVSLDGLLEAPNGSPTATATQIVSATPTLAASLMVVKLVDKVHAAPGEVLQYTLVVINDMLSGEDPGSYVRLLDQLPEELEFVAGSLSAHATYEADTRSILWSGQVARGGSLEVAFQARLTPAAGTKRSLVNTVLVTDAFGRDSVASAQTHIVQPLLTATPTATARAPEAEHTLYLPLALKNAP